MFREEITLFHLHQMLVCLTLMLNAMRANSVTLMERVEENISLKSARMKEDGLTVLKILPNLWLKDIWILVQTCNMLLEEAQALPKLWLDSNILITVINKQIELLLFLIGITNGSVVTLEPIQMCNANVLVKSSTVTMMLQMDQELLTHLLK